ncbi:MAG: hypothetical protein M0P99_04715 [Candidatus Cloacimonetes bacterium]|nr:hypothetical protein [Candidatus Cloacimonadota bacterium]
MGLLIIILVLVALVYIISKSTKQASLPRKNSVRKLNSTNATTYEIANKVRILIESAKIVSETKNYEVKISRSKLMLEMLDKLSKTNTPHFTKGENWDNLVQELSDYDSKLMVLTRSLQ